VTIIKKKKKRKKPENTQKSEKMEQKSRDSCEKETTLRKRLESRWEELKHEVDKKFRSFQRRVSGEGIKATNTEHRNSINLSYCEASQDECNIANKKSSERENNDDDSKHTSSFSAFSNIDRSQSHGMPPNYSATSPLKNPLNKQTGASQNDTNEFSPNMLTRRRSSVYSHVHITSSFSSYDNLSNLPVRELRKRLNALNVNTDIFIEKKDLVEELRKMSNHIKPEHAQNTINQDNITGKKRTKKTNHQKDKCKDHSFAYGSGFPFDNSTS